ncbi:MAG TPA: TatD family hydrolase [Patescibacteria group bacterium]|nr:TatD family hydrolase [Patescibacteria group bacterium]
MKLIDTHCHLNFRAFHTTYREIIEQALSYDMGLIIVGAAKDTSERAVMMAHEYQHDSVYAAVGQHPSHVTDEPFDADWLKSLAHDSKVVAIGETGIDLYRPEEIASHELQKEFLQGHARIAQELSKPLIIHSRGTAETLQTAIDDVLEILHNSYDSLRHPLVPRGRASSSPSPYEGEGGGEVSIPAVFHCFTGTAQQAQQILDAGCMISFTGVITFAKELEDTVKTVPLDRLMIETDSPYLAPARYRGKQNEPLYVEEVARKVADIHGIEYDEVLEQTTRNAIEFFGL